MVAICRFGSSASTSTSKTVGFWTPRWRRFEQGRALWRATVCALYSNAFGRGALQSDHGDVCCRKSMTVSHDDCIKVCLRIVQTVALECAYPSPPQQTDTKECNSHVLIFFVFMFANVLQWFKVLCLFVVPLHDGRCNHHQQGVIIT